MQNVIAFLVKYHVLFLFIGLEILCVRLITRYNHFQRVGIITTTNALSGKLLQKSSEVRGFVALQEVNDSLISENQQLRNRLQALQLQVTHIEEDTTFVKPIVIDSSAINVYEYYGAKVINNSTTNVNNYITIDKGSKHGVEAETAVLGQVGIVGVIKEVSENYALAISLLHNNMRVSAKIDRNNYVGSLRWNNLNPEYAVLDDIPKNVVPEIGDTIATSGFSAFFPPDIPVGVIHSWTQSGSKSFLNIKVRLFTNFSNLKYVYVVKNKGRKERLELEAETKLD
ncbi:MAG: rod shape-determining protein MreC [Chitinophagales bacterium]